MTTLKIHDNSKIKKNEFSVITQLTQKVADNTLGVLEEEGVFIFPSSLKKGNDITKDEMILKSF